MDMVVFALENPAAAVSGMVERATSGIAGRWERVRAKMAEVRGALTRRKVAAAFLAPLALTGCVSLNTTSVPTGVGSSSVESTTFDYVSNGVTSRATMAPSDVPAFLNNPNRTAVPTGTGETAGDTDNGAVAGKDKITEAMKAVGAACLSGDLQRDRNEDSALQNDTTIDDQSFRARPTAEQLTSTEFASAKLKEMLDPCTGDPVQAATYLLTFKHKGDMSKLTDKDFADEATKLKADPKYWADQVRAIEEQRVPGSMKIEKMNSRFITVGIRRDDQGNPVAFKHTYEGLRHVVSQEFSSIDPATGKTITFVVQSMAECDQVANVLPVATPKKPTPITKKPTSTPNKTCPVLPGYAKDKEHYIVTKDANGCWIVAKKTQSTAVKKDGGTAGAKQAVNNNTTSGVNTGSTKGANGLPVTEQENKAPVPLDPANPSAPTGTGTKGGETSPIGGSPVPVSPGLSNGAVEK